MEQSNWIGQLIQGKDAAQYLNNIAQFATGAARQCPNCGDNISGVHAIQNIETIVLYGLPCNCRLGHWDSVPQWIRDDLEIIESDITQGDEPSDEEIIEMMREMGIEISMTLEEWQAYCQQQEASGQLRLPLDFKE